jgi:cyclopropane-fatty-acyl-phospholipid synthase
MAAFGCETFGSLQKHVVYWILQKLLRSGNSDIAVDGRASAPSGCRDPIVLRLPNLYQMIKILIRPDVMIGQAYVDGAWSVQPEKLYDFLLLIRSQEDSRLQNWFVFSSRFHLIRDAFKQRVFPIRSTRAVAEHYNSNPSFISLVLGPSLSYTCAFFDDDCYALEDAQNRKVEKICERIALSKDHNVLELGVGWGASAFPLAEKYHCNVTGITISEAQERFCNDRKNESSARDRLEFVRIDYSEYCPPSPFDRVVSVGMLEHVGKYQYRKFFDKVGSFIKPEGVALIHSMVEEQETSTDAWIDKNIFPGGYIPTISEVIAGIEKSNCQLVDLFIHPKEHYFRTLECWKQNLLESKEECRRVLEERGLSGKEAISVIRIWEYFLSCSQIAFSAKYGRCRVAHFLVKKKIECA